MTPVRCVPPVAILTTALALFGCGPSRLKTYPAKGVVAYKDAGTSVTPLDGGFVRLELVSDPTTTAQGKIEDEGKFELLMYKGSASFGGLVPGEYRGRIEPPGYDDLETDDARAKKLRQVKPKYLSYDKSGLKFQIEPRDNALKIEVEK